MERLSTGERTVVVDRGGDARYLSTGHLIYGLDGALVAAPFDLGRLEVTGGAVSLLDNVSLSRATGALDADVAQTGALVYLPAGSEAFLADRTFVWVDRDGTEEPLAAPPRPYAFPRISPDGTRVAVDIRDQGSES